MTDIEKIAADVTSLHWWLMVVFAGLAINVASRFIERPLDALRSKVSVRWTTASEKRRAEIDAQGRLLADNPSLLALEIRAEAFAMRMGSLFFLTAIGAITLGVLGIQFRYGAPNPVSEILGEKSFVRVTLLGGALLMAVGQYLFRTAMKHSVRLHAARKHLEAIHPPRSADRSGRATD